MGQSHLDEEAKIEGADGEALTTTSDSSPSNGPAVAVAKAAAAAASTKTRPEGILAKLRRYEAVLDAKLGVEAHAVDRKRAEDRDPSFASWHN